MVDIDPEHMVADYTRNRMYVTVLGGAQQYPNRLVIVDPCDGSVLDSVFVGSNPSSMAMSGDGTTLWVGLDGSHELARVDLTTDPPTVEAQFGLPTHNGNQTVARSMVVLPGTSTSVAVSTHRLDVSRSFAGVAILDDGVARPVKTPGHSGAAELTGGPEGWLFGYNNLSTAFDFYSLEILDDGPAQIATDSLVSGFRVEIVYSEGLVFATSGEIVDVSDPSAPKPEGEFAWAGAVLPQPEAGRVLMLSPPAFNQSDTILRELDPAMFTQIDSSSYDLGEVLDVDVDAITDFGSGDGVMLGFLTIENQDGPRRLVLLPDPF